MSYRGASIMNSDPALALRMTRTIARSPSFLAAFGWPPAVAPQVSNLLLRPEAYFLFLV